MPKLWTDTIEEHREAVHDATLDAAAALIAEHGLASVTMSAIASAAGIGRATLYKYFPDVEAILLAWHERQIATHLQYLIDVRDKAAPRERLAAVLTAFAHVSHHGQGGDMAGALHRHEHVGEAERRLTELVRNLVVEAAARGNVRKDVPPDELAAYCLHALGAADGLSSRAALARLVEVTLAGLQPPRRSR